MPRKSKSDAKAGPHADPIVAATLAEAAALGWREVTHAGVAARAEMPLGALLLEAPTKAHLLARFLKHVDHETLQPVTALDDADTSRDRLFEVMMRRFDVLSRHRDGAQAIVRGLGRDPAAAAMGWLRFDRSGAAMLAAAGISANGLCGLARIQGLKVIYLATLRAWMSDDTEDLAKTMAALDRALRQAERMLRLLPGRRRGGAEEPAAEAVAS